MRARFWALPCLVSCSSVSCRGRRRTSARAGLDCSSVADSRRHSTTNESNEPSASRSHPVSRTRPSASSASATSACRSPSNSRAPDSTSPASTSTPSKIDADQRRHAATSPTSRSASSPKVVKRASCARRPTWRELGDDGRDRHLRADAAAEDEGSGPVVRRAGGRGGRRDAAARPAGRSSSRRPIRARPTKWCSRCSRRRASRPTSISSSRSRPSASIRATRSSRRGTSRRSSAASGRRAPRRRRRSTAQIVSTRRAGQLDARRRDGEAAREHVPRGEHRPGERDRADVPQDGHRRVGSDRRGEDQAVRLHAVLSGPGPRRPLHSDRSVLPVVEGAAERLRVPLHRAGRPGQRRRCPTTSSSAWPTR